MLIRCRAGACTFVLILALCCLPVAASDAVAFTNVTVIPMDRERTLPGWTVVVRDGRIFAAGPNAEVEAPAGARRVDGTGKYLMPGLVDAHVHLTARDDLFLFLANGVTTVQGMGAVAESTREWGLEIAAGKLLGPNYYNCDRVAVGLKTAAEAETFIADTRKSGFDCIKIYSPPDWTEEAYKALTRGARKNGIRTVGHLPRNLTLDTVLSEGQEVIAHAEEYLYAHFDKLENSRALDTMPDVVRKTIQNHVAVVPNLVAYHLIGLQTGPRVDELMRRTELQYVPAYIRENWSPQFNRYRMRLTPEDSVKLLRTYEFLQKLTALLQAGGAVLAVGTDASPDMPFVVPGFSALEEVKELVAAGLTPYQALHAATAGAARSMKAEKEFGQVQTGMRADLLLLEANPLHDVSNLARRAGVMVRGQWFPERELRKRFKTHLASVQKRDRIVHNILQAGLQGRMDEALRLYRRDPGSPMDEGEINTLGYQYLSVRKNVDAAIALFRFNVALFPSSWNAFDSLGEAYAASGQKALAIRNYEKSVDLGSQNPEAPKILRQLRGAN